MHLPKIRFCADCGIRTGNSDASVMVWIQMGLCLDCDDIAQAAAIMAMERMLGADWNLA
jgi:hypothetical protein